MRISDWSSDVCSSDLDQASIAGHAEDVADRIGMGAHGARLLATVPFCGTFGHVAAMAAVAGAAELVCLDRKSVVEGKSVSVRVDLGGARIIKKKNTSKDRSYINNS